MTRIRVSVVVPVHDGEPFVAEAIESIRRQSRPADEVWVVDDGSTDGTPAVLAGIRDIRVVTQPNRGAGAARNAAIRRATGDVVAFLDADDLWLPNKLELQLAALSAEPSRSLWFGHVEQFGAPEFMRGQRRVLPGFIPSTLLATRDALSEIGPFEEGPDVPEFASWYLRARDVVPDHGMVPDVVARRRLHANNKGRGSDAARRGYVLALRRALARRREKDDEEVR